jgi:hypothetical protein
MPAAVPLAPSRGQRWTYRGFRESSLHRRPHAALSRRAVRVFYLRRFGSRPLAMRSLSLISRLPSSSISLQHEPFEWLLIEGRGTFDARGRGMRRRRRGGEGGEGGEGEERVAAKKRTEGSIPAAPRGITPIKTPPPGPRIHQVFYRRATGDRGDYFCV